jgi:FAD/FMN-containing dehydrogenase
MPIRHVVQGDQPPAAPSVRAALDLLHGPAAGLQSLADDLAAGLSDGHNDVKIDRPSRLLYATDASLYEMEPVAVVFPHTTADVQHALRIAKQRGIPILSRGGGTSLAGQTVNHAIVLDFTPHMDRVLEINAQQHSARVQPGVVLTELNRIAAAHNLLYPIDPSTANRATIGGGIGNNSCGTHSALYGKTIDNVISIDVVLADGSTATFEQQAGSALEAKLAAGDLEGDLYRGLQRIAHAQRDEIEARFPKILRRVSTSSPATARSTWPA